MAALATGYMNRTQSFDGILSHGHAEHVSHHPGINRSLKAEAAQSIRRVYKRIIAQELDDMCDQELDDMDEVDPEIVDFENNHGQGYDDEDIWSEDLATGATMSLQEPTSGCIRQPNNLAIF